MTTDGKTSAVAMRRTSADEAARSGIWVGIAAITMTFAAFTSAALITGAAQFIFLYNLIYSRFRGKVAPVNPWEATSLEWTIPSPPPWNNFGDRHPIVYHDPHQYGVKGSLGDYVMQDSPEKIENES